jgi:hypothetical protein
LRIAQQAMCANGFPESFYAVAGAQNYQQVAHRSSSDFSALTFRARERLKDPAIRNVYCLRWPTSGSIQFSDGASEFG